MAAGNYLYRYTDLPALIHILTTRTITLLNPQTWDDKNDTFLMSEYKQRSRAKTLLALCFTEAGTETYHHWRVFSYGSHGVRIRFNKEKLLDRFGAEKRIRHRSVKYKNLNFLKAAESIEMEELPFLKRNFYEDEREYRLIYASRTRTLPAKDYDIDLACIEGITLSPWMATPLFDSVRQTIRSIDGCADLRVSRSTATGSDLWRTAAVNAVDRGRPDRSRRSTGV